MPTVLTGTPPYPETLRTLRLTPSMRRALLVAVSGDGVQWDAEDALGVSGAAFWKVLDALLSRELVDKDYCVTPLGWSARRLIRAESAVTL